MRIFFATDIHGSEVCWRKFVNAGKFYKANILILGGDMTGKAIVPILNLGNGRYRSVFLEQELDLNTDAEVEELEKAIANRGYYPVRLTPDELAAAQTDKQVVEEIYHREAKARVQRWLDFAAERLAGTGIQAFCCPGNDDIFAIDRVIRDHGAVAHGEDRVLEVQGGYRLISCGWANPTPWNTYRELPEDRLAAKLARMGDQINGDMHRTICNFHCPPYGSTLDEAPELDEQMRPKFAGRSLVPVGSKAMAEFIDRRQPLLTLHGHIHESRAVKKLGKTVSINPGSQYEQGVLMGAIVDIGPRGVDKYMLTTG